MNRVRAFCVRGLFGAVFSTGMNDLANELNTIPGCSATAEGNSLFPLAVIGDLTHAAMASALSSGRKIVLVGHSYGGFAVESIAAGLRLHNIDTALLVMVDTTKDSPYVPDSGGIRIQYYQSIDPMGGGTPDSVPNARTPLERVKLNLTHTEMDKTPIVHQRVMAEVKKIIAAN
ncbi:MAG TPA: hypothetical protein VKT73_13230 [Xanthobacteraceae bacterium]|nr:hypothetical protein [Xanthobacteraceae bacterium]